jgi:hypothetical protein
MDKEIEELLKSDKMKIKPSECGLIYDDKRGLLVAICNKDGEIRNNNITTKVLSNLFESLSAASISFELAELRAEEDTEIESWAYVFVKVKLDVDERVFNALHDHLIADAYSKVTADDAVKVLLVLEHV